MNMPMAEAYRCHGKRCKGIEDYIPHTPVSNPEHQNKVVGRHSGKLVNAQPWRTNFAIFATSSIPEAIEYYRLFKLDQYKTQNCRLCLTLILIMMMPQRLSTKEARLKEIVEDYNARYGQHFSIPFLPL